MKKGFWIAALIAAVLIVFVGLAAIGGTHPTQTAQVRYNMIGKH